MRIAVAGGTGTIGRRVAASLSRDGHEVRVLSRRAADYPADVTTGAGMDAALVGCDVVINASNGPSPRKAPAVLVEGPHHLLDAGVRAGVGHHVCVSIVGIDAMPMAYYRVKLEQERVVESADVPWPIVRSTQSGRYVVEIPIPLPGKLGRALCEGGLTCVNPDVRGTETFAAGLKANAQ